MDGHQRHRRRNRRRQCAPRGAGKAERRDPQGKCRVAREPAVARRKYAAEIARRTRNERTCQDWGPITPGQFRIPGGHCCFATGQKSVAGVCRRPTGQGQLLAGPGQFRDWIEGGAIFSGGDPISDTYGLTGQFDLTPKVGWETATGFDYRFVGSPWHISGQFRYGEGGKSTGLDSLTQTIVVGAASQTGTEIFANTYKETRWLADLAVGRDIAGSGPSTLQLKGGLRVAEFVTRSSSSDVQAATSTGVALPGFPAITSFSTTLSTLRDTRASFLGAGPLIGVEGSVPFGGKWSFDYAGDAALLLGRQQSATSSSTLFSVTPSVLSPLFPVANTLSTSNDRLFAGVLSADIQVGVSYWMTQNLKLGAGYRLDAFINVFNQAGSSNSGLTPDRYTHGPRVTLTGAFDAM